MLPLPEKSSLALSIIIPTLNEVSYLRTTVTHVLNVAANRKQLEVIIIDAGSTDGTLDSVSDLPCEIIQKKEFRLQKHKSLNFGIEQAQGSVILFLDADTLLPPGFDAMILKALENHKVVGGAFEMRFTNADLKLHLLSLLNSLRYRIWSTYFGDQAIFCSKAKALQVGGFPDSLMEAAFFCRRLQKSGELRLIKEKVKTSPRRFTENGFWKVLWFDLKMWIKFIFDGDLKSPRPRYWKVNLE